MSRSWLLWQRATGPGSVSLPGLGSLLPVVVTLPPSPSASSGSSASSGGASSSSSSSSLFAHGPGDSFLYRTAPPPDDQEGGLDAAATADDGDGDGDGIHLVVPSSMAALNLEASLRAHVALSPQQWEAFSHLSSSLNDESAPHGSFSSSSSSSFPPSKKEGSSSSSSSSAYGTSSSNGGGGTGVTSTPSLHHHGTQGEVSSPSQVLAVPHHHPSPVHNHFHHHRQGNVVTAAFVPPSSFPPQQQGVSHNSTVDPTYSESYHRPQGGHSSQRRMTPHNIGNPNNNGSNSSSSSSSGGGGGGVRKTQRHPYSPPPHHHPHQAIQQHQQPYPYQYQYQHQQHHDHHLQQQHQHQHHQHQPHPQAHTPTQGPPPQQAYSGGGQVTRGNRTVAVRRGPRYGGDEGGSSQALPPPVVTSTSVSMTSSPFGAVGSPPPPASSSSSSSSSSHVLLSSSASTHASSLDGREVKVGWWSSPEERSRAGPHLSSDAGRASQCSADCRLLFMAIQETGERLGLGTPIKVLMGHKRMSVSTKLRLSLEAAHVWGQGMHNPYAVWRAIAFAFVDLGDEWLSVEGGGGGRQGQEHRMVDDGDGHDEFGSENGTASSWKRVTTYELGPAARRFLNACDPPLLPLSIMEAIAASVTRDVEAYLHLSAQKRRDVVPTLSSKRLEVFQMFQSGLDIREIAERRGVGVGTVTGHLAECLEQGLVIDFDRLGISPAVVTAVLEVAETLGGLNTTNLKPIKRALPSYVTYENIRCVLAYHRLEKGSCDRVVAATMALCDE